MKQGRPFKIIKRTVGPEPATAEPAPLVTQEKKPLKLVRPLSPRAQTAIHGILNGKPAGQAMQEAGYTKATSINPSKNLLSRPAAQDEIDAFVKKLLHHRDEIMDQMRESYVDASYSELSMSLNNLIKNIQLLTGRATGKMSFDLPPEQAEAIKAIVELNSKK